MTCMHVRMYARIKDEDQSLNSVAFPRLPFFRKHLFAYISPSPSFPLCLSLSLSPPPSMTRTGHGVIIYIIFSGSAHVYPVLFPQCGAVLPTKKKMQGNKNRPCEIMHANL